MKEHLRDIFQILSHLRSCHSNDPAFPDFKYLIHRRAFRKLGWRIQEFLGTNWGQSPFLVIKDAVQSAEVVSSPEFLVSILPNELKILRFSRFPCFEEPPDDGVTYKVRVESQNIGKWLDAFARHFDKLKKQFPPPDRAPSQIPTPRRVKIGVLYIRCFMKLKSVIKYILKIPGVETALLRAGTL